MSQPSDRDALFAMLAQELGYRFDGEIKIGGQYVSVVEHGSQLWVSGQIPRVGDAIIVTGRAGTTATLAQAQLGARICALRALALLRNHLGTLGRVQRVLRVGVFVQSADDFTQQSEVADAASGVLVTVLGAAGAHARTSVGVHQLPKNATVELDLVAAFE